jgi:hypothetical protein
MAQLVDQQAYLEIDLCDELCNQADADYRVSIRQVPTQCLS